MESIYNQILQTLKNRQHGSLVTILHRKGSVPRREGAHLLLKGNGSIIGTIGGGGLEAETVKIARNLLDSENGHLRSFTLVEGDDPSDMACGGNVTVLVEPILRGEIPVYEFITRSLKDHVPCCFIRLIRRSEINSHTVQLGPKGTVKADGTTLFTLPLSEDVKSHLVAWAQISMKDASHTIRVLDPEAIDLPAADSWDMYIFESLQVFPRLVIFGGGHLSQALCKMAALCNFQVEIVDDREEFASKERFPEATRVLCIPDFEHLGDLIRLDGHTFSVVATRGHRYDESVLSQVIDYDLAYIGMVGSRQKNALVFERLRERGIPPSRLKRVHAPIGLSIGSETPEEIAVSILGEIIQTRAERKKTN